MKVSLKKLVIRGLGGLGVVAAGLTVAVAARQHRKFDAPYPAIHASRDPAVIERGRYLAFGAAHCTSCHGASEAPGATPNAAAAPVLSGGHEFALPVGVFRAPNITPDAATGIGRYSDEEIARMLRYGVRPNGEVLLPFMPFQNLSDEDLTALVSFLRAQVPVAHEVAPHEPNLLGRVVKAFVLAPRGPSAPNPARVPREVTVEYGRYLANSVGNCVGCHTKLDLRTGEYIGPKFAGGAEHPSTSDAGKSFVTPNLTPDPRWGWLNGWSEDAFVARLRAGRVRPGSPMPWETFATIDEADARALYRYFKSLPASPGGPDPKDRDSVAQSVAAR
ncbi:MAG TPA: c-type cytochrome [Polyangiaceae bacterium]|jgi:mono/diheme cytochrome c family protein|nr:c-type cytochrome [Polyangiaceae bacterium]